MKRYHDVEDVTFEGDFLLLKLGEETHRFPLAAISSRLLRASPAERARFEISPSGYGIHWPLIDEDLSIDGLLGVSHSPAVTKGKAA